MHTHSLTCPSKKGLTRLSMRRARVVGSCAAGTSSGAGRSPTSAQAQSAGSTQDWLSRALLWVHRQIAAPPGPQAKAMALEITDLAPTFFDNSSLPPKQPLLLRNLTDPRNAALAGSATASIHNRPRTCFCVELVKPAPDSINRRRQPLPLSVAQCVQVQDCPQWLVLTCGRPGP